VRLTLGDSKAVAVDLLESGVEPAAVDARQPQLCHDVVVRSTDRTPLTVGDHSLNVVWKTCHCYLRVVTEDRTILPLVLVRFEKQKMPRSWSSAFVSLAVDQETTSPRRHQKQS